MSEVRLWTVATGGVDPSKKASRKAAEYIIKLHGFKAVHILDLYHMLWLFDTENNAKIARNKMESKGIVCGKNICPVNVDDKYMKGKATDGEDPNRENQR